MLISKSRFPRPYQQNIYVNGKLNTTVGSCVACSFTRIIEVLNYIATGTYTNMSVGYLYGRHNKPYKKSGGKPPLLQEAAKNRYQNERKTECEKTAVIARDMLLYRRDN